MQSGFRLHCNNCMWRNDNDQHDDHNHYNNDYYHYYNYNDYHNNNNHDDDYYHNHNYDDHNYQHNDKHDNDRKPAVRDVSVGVLRNDGRLRMARRWRLLHWWVRMSRTGTWNMRRRKCWIDDKYELRLMRYERKRCLLFLQLVSLTATTLTVHGRLFRTSSVTPRVLRTLSL